MFLLFGFSVHSTAPASAYEREGIQVLDDSTRRKCTEKSCGGLSLF